jgi:hypothetical protein
MTSLCVCAVLRCISIYHTYYTTYDMTWESQSAWLWLSIEAHLAVVCASAPALKTFFKHTLKDYTYGFRRSGKSSNSDPSTEQSGYSGRTDTRGAIYGGQRGGFSAAVESGYGNGGIPEYNSRGEKMKPWEIRIDSEHELVYTKGKVPSLKDDEFHYGHRF